MTTRDYDPERTMHDDALTYWRERYERNPRWSDTVPEYRRRIARNSLESTLTARKDTAR